MQTDIITMQEEKKSNIKRNTSTTFPIDKSWAIQLNEADKTHRTIGSVE